MQHLPHVSSAVSTSQSTAHYTNTRRCPTCATACSAILKVPASSASFAWASAISNGECPQPRIRTRKTVDHELQVGRWQPDHHIERPAVRAAGSLTASEIRKLLL
eukprot:COSAG01_NODE_906_length_12834_cov_53.626620_11_plen_105_part_00